jgi:hypothetical protein
MPDETGDGGHADQEQNGSDSEQKAQKSQQQSHRRAVPPSLNVHPALWRAVRDFRRLQASA